MHFLLQISVLLYFGVVSAAKDYPRNVIKELTVENGGKWGDWHDPEFCPDGMYASGYKMKIEKPQKTSDDTALNAIKLSCKGHIGGIPGPEVGSGEAQWGMWTSYANCAEHDGLQDFITGFRLQVERSQGIGDDTAANLMKVHCSNFEYGAAYDIEPSAKGVWGQFGRWSESCPPESAVCGIQTKIEPKQGKASDDTALNDVKLYCCKQNDM